MSGTPEAAKMLNFLQNEMGVKRRPIYGELIFWYKAGF